MRLTRQGMLTAILVVAALFLGSVVTKWIPTADDLFVQPFERSGSVGEPVSLRTGTVTVDGLRSASEITLFGSTAITTDLWLVADLTWHTEREAALLDLDSIRLETVDGVRYGGLPALVPSCGPAQPGLPLRCMVHFEVPADVLEGATLLIPAEASLSSADDVAVIDLGIDDARAAELAVPGEPIALDEGRPA